MPEEMTDSIRDVLERTSKGQGTFPELAAALKSLPHMVALTPPSEFRRFMEDMEAARKERERKVSTGELPSSEIFVKTSDVESPRLSGIQTKEGFVPRVFTNDDIAREFAVTSGLIQPDEVMPFLSKGWVDGLLEFLVKGCPGIVIDDGSDHKINLERPSVARLYAVMTLEEFARLPSLHVVTHGGRTFYQRPKPGSVQVFVYDNPKAASYGLLQAQKAAPGAGVVETKTPELLSEILEAGVTLLVVNHSIPDARFYNRDELLKMVELLGGPVTTPTRPPAAAGSKAPQPVVDPALQPQGRPAATTAAAAQDLPAPLRRALATETPPMIPPPDQDDVDAQMLFQEWREKAARKDFDVFQLVEVLAFQLKLYAPVHYRNVDGLTWPQFFRSPEDQNKTFTYLFTKKEAVEKFLANDPPEHRRFLTLSGIEAMRWIWAAPRSIDTIAIDYYPNSPAWLTFPNHWALSAIYPLFYDVPDLRKVPAVALEKLGGLPGARGLKPEVVRALVLGWKQLFCFEGDTPVTIEHQGKRYLPVFSSPERLMEFSSLPNAPSGKPKALAGAQPPFQGWLEATADDAGVLLDPAGPHPLPLHPTELLVLSLWADRTARGPDGSDIANAVGQLLGQRRISATRAAQIAADYPRYWVGLKHTQEGGGALLMVPKTDGCALFTSSDGGQRYVEFYLGMESIRPQLEGMQILPVLSNWQNSALALAANQFSEAWIDPDVLAPARLVFDRQGMEAARARIDQKLMPRVPGFIWEA